MLQRLRDEFLEVIGLYWRLLKKPTLFFTGLWLVLCDWFVNIPRSFFRTPEGEPRADKLNRHSSFALGTSELVTIPGTYSGLWLFSMMGANKYVASVIGGAVGNYVSGVVSFAVIYLATTRRVDRYRLTQAIGDSLKVIRDAFPVALLLYFLDAPVISGLLAIGLSKEVAVGLNLILGMALFTGVAKDSSLEGIKRTKFL